MVDNYNMTFLDSAVSLNDWIIGLNRAAGGILMPIILLLIAIIIAAVMHSSGSSTQDVMLADSFITSVIALFFFVAGYIGGEILAIPLVLLAIAVFAKIFFN